MMNERTYLRLKKQIEADYRQKLAALETIWAMCNKGQESGVAKQSRTTKGELINAVIMALKDLSQAGEFTVREVMGKIAKRDGALAASIKRASVSSALKRLVAGNMIVVTVQGVGKRPSQYRVVSVPETKVVEMK